MDHQDTAVCKGILPVRLLFPDIAQHIKGGSAGTHPFSFRIRQNGIMRLRRKQPLLQTAADLFSVILCLLFVGSRNNEIIPYDEITFIKASLIIFPGVQIRLPEEEIFHFSILLLHSCTLYIYNLSNLLFTAGISSYLRQFIAAYIFLCVIM